MAPRTLLGAPWVHALPLHTQAPLLGDPGLSLAPHWPSSCPGTTPSTLLSPLLSSTSSRPSTSRTTLPPSR